MISTLKKSNFFLHDEMNQIRETSEESSMWDSISRPPPSCSPKTIIRRTSFCNEINIVPFHEWHAPDPFNYKLIIVLNECVLRLMRMTLHESIWQCSISMINRISHPSIKFSLYWGTLFLIVPWKEKVYCVFSPANILFLVMAIYYINLR